MGGSSKHTKNAKNAGSAKEAGKGVREDGLASLVLGGSAQSEARSRKEAFQRRSFIPAMRQTFRILLSCVRVIRKPLPPAWCRMSTFQIQKPSLVSSFCSSLGFGTAVLGQTVRATTAASRNGTISTPTKSWWWGENEYHSKRGISHALISTPKESSRSSHHCSRNGIERRPLWSQFTTQKYTLRMRQDDEVMQSYDGNKNNNSSCRR